MRHRDVFLVEVLWEIVTMDIPKLRNYCAGIIGKE